MNGAQAENSRPVFVFSRFKQATSILVGLLIVLFLLPAGLLMFWHSLATGVPVMVLYSSFIIFLCAMLVLIILSWIKLFRDPLYLSIQDDGFVLREFGFIHWKNIEEIGYDSLGLAFQFRSADTADAYPSSGWNFLRNIRYRDGRVLAFMRTTEMFGLNCSGEKADWREVLLNLECYYGLWLDPTLKQEKDGMPQLDGKRLKEVIQAQKHGIKFGNKYKDMARAFTSLSEALP